MADPFVFPIRVYIEDTDAGGIVYHANHIRYFERARTEWLRAQGVSHYWDQRDYAFVVHQLSVEYHKPIFMDNLLQVTVEVHSCKSVSFTLRQSIYRDEMRLASATVTLACLDQHLKPRRIPESIHDLIVKCSIVNCLPVKIV
jgi:acyl-CoA thioester hydrolase